MSSLVNFYNMKEVKKYNQKYQNPCYEKTGIQHPFRMLIVGGSGSGKTQTLLNIIKSCPNTFDYVVLCVKTREEPLYKFLIDKLKSNISIYEEGNLPTLDDIKKFSDNGKDQVLIIYDDLVLLKNQQPIEEMFIRGRKLNCSMCYLTQSYYRTPKVIRINCNYIILKKLSSNRDLKMILREYDVGVNETELMKMYNASTRTKLEFLTIRIDEDHESPLKFTRNFLEKFD